MSVYIYIYIYSHVSLGFPHVYNNYFSLTITLDYLYLTQNSI